MDRVSPAKRRENMQRIKAKDSVPELAVRRTLRALGVHYRLHVRNLPGSPDIVIRRRRLVIFVHGCFWHRHPGCRRAYVPSTRTEWWLHKFQTNVDRDNRAIAALLEKGWKVFVIWECETKNQEILDKVVRNILAECPILADEGTQ
ncbi:very short patch repair endonuclease [Microvirga roseola]|uniref:very short patch repair endonuclease n=1 Tax=Microvirga roseola TaxID=2883126 RepID=UPI0022A842A3|nr:DNA mismatch endonuclease Vsr [Microvirga roseola]